MDQLKSALDVHMDQMSDLFQKFSSDLQSGLRPAYDNLIGFFHAIDWHFQETRLIGLLGFHAVLLLIVFLSRKRINFQFCIFFLLLAGVYFAERLNKVLNHNWKSFASQNYFDPHGVFLSVLWSGPLLLIAIIILINTLYSLCFQIVKWKRAELRHRARLAHNKQD